MSDDVSREFAMSYADLIEVCDNFHSCITRDAAEMSVYGVTPLATAAFKTKINEFLAFPTDAILTYDMMSATQHRNTLANNLRIMARTFGVRAKIAFADNTGRYERFVLDDLSHATDGNLLVFCEMVAHEAAKYLVEFEPLGMSQQTIDDFVTATNEFRLAMIAQDDAVMLRDETANLRMKKANELYKLLVNYSNMGKNIWYEVNEALYNDYIIYDYTGSNSTGGVSAVPAAPENLSVDVNTMIYSWSSVPNTSVYQLEKSVVGIEWEIIYTGPDNFVMYVPENEGINLYRVKGSNVIGSGLYSSLMSFNYNALPDAPTNLVPSVEYLQDTQVSLTFTPVSEISEYILFLAYGPQGSNVTPELLANITASGTPILIPTTHSYERYFMGLKSYDGTNYSEMSEFVWIDVDGLHPPE